MKNSEKMHASVVRLMMCHRVPFLNDAWACSYKIVFVIVRVGVVLFCWELFIMVSLCLALVRVVGLAECLGTTRSSPRSLTVSLRHVKFWYSWRPTEMCVVVRYYRNTYITPCIKSVLRDATFTAPLRDLAISSVTVFVDRLRKRDGRESIWATSKIVWEKCRWYFWSLRVLFWICLPPFSWSAGSTK